MKLLILLLLFSSVLFGSSELKKLYMQSKTDIYKAMDRKNFNLAVDFFKDVFHSKTMKIDKCNFMNFDVRKINDFVVIEDKRDIGSGFFIINSRLNAASMLSIPHRFNDLRTGTIGYKLFATKKYKAIAFNTVSRKKMDSAHTYYTVFNAFHKAFSEVYPQEMVYQIHGFSSAKHKSIVSSNMAIVSSSKLTATKEAKNVYKCLNKGKISALLYGKNVFELGATKNTQAKTLHFYNFMHIELSDMVRKRLYENRDTLMTLGKCLK